MINKFRFIKKIGNYLAKNIGNTLKSVASNSFVNKLVQPAATIAGMIPVAGGFAEKMIEDAPKTTYEFGNLLTGMSEGKKLKDLLHNYDNNTELIGNPLNTLTLANEGINELRKWIKK